MHAFFSTTTIFFHRLDIYALEITRNMNLSEARAPKNISGPLTQDHVGKPSAITPGHGLTILQHQRGYRFGLDALLLATDLARFGLGDARAHGEAARRPCVVELGAAQGIVSLCVARQFAQVDVVALERQEALFGLLKRNIAVNQLADQVRGVRVDIREIPAGGAANDKLGISPHSADLVLCNPPYFKKGARRPSQNPERAAARHELHGGLGDFVGAARYILTQRGRLKIILPPIRLAELLSCAAGTDLAVETLRFFHSRADTAAYLVECVLRRGGSPDMQVRPPLYIYQIADDYSDEVRRRVDGAAMPNPRGHL